LVSEGVIAMESQGNEGKDPAAQAAAEEWRRRFGREGHEGSYARHDDGEASDDKPAPPEEPSRTSAEDSSA
jgi:hypothetical protein